MRKDFKHLVYDDGENQIVPIQNIRYCPERRCTVVVLDDEEATIIPMDSAYQNIKDKNEDNKL